MNIKASVLISVLVFSLACKKAESPPKSEPAKPVAAKKPLKPAPKPPEPKKPVAKKPAPKKPKPLKASREVPDKKEGVLKDILDINAPEIVDSKLPVLVFFGAIWTATHRMSVGILEEAAVKYAGRVKFYNVDYPAAKAKNLLPEEVTVLPYLMFIKDGKRFGKVGFSGNPKELDFAIKDWLAGEEDDDEDEEEIE